MSRTTLAFLLAVLAPGTAIAQQDTAQAGDILRTILLPRVSEILRERGVPAEEVEEVVIGARRRQIPPEETTAILEEAAASIDENGPIDNFGAFVQQQLDRGLRGRELSAAIREEHARRGIGKGRKLQGRGRGERETGPDSTARPDTLGTPGRRPAGRRRPDSTLNRPAHPTAPERGTYEE